MADASASALILFIAAVAVAAGVAGMMTTTVQDISSSVDVRGDSVSSEIRSDITIINDTGSDGLYDADENELTLYVKNTGSEPLTPADATIDVLIDGQYVEIDTLETLGDGERSWRPGEVLELTLTVELEDEHRVLVHTNNNEDTVVITV